MGTVSDAANKEPNGSLLDDKSVTVVFVLGGPGSGKGTQCAKIVEHFRYTHLSAGDLLRAEQKSGSENGTMIQNTIKDGKIVPAEVTIKLLQRAMNESGNNKFLIDGFPRDEVNRAAFEKVTGIEPAFVLFFYCSEEEMEKRLLARNQGREDDNIETIRKRFKVFLYSSIPVVNYYTFKGKVHKIDANKSVDEVFEAVKAVFTSSETKEMQVYRNMKMRAEELKAEHVKALESVKKDGAVEIEDDEDVKADEDVQGDEMRISRQMRKRMPVRITRQMRKWMPVRMSRQMRKRMPMKKKLRRNSRKILK